MSKALVILSGGQDSTTCLFWAKQNFDEVHAITFQYEQRHSCEVLAAQDVAEAADVVAHAVMRVGPILGGSSPLVALGNDVESYESWEKLPGGLEATFVPMRNALFLVLAANYAYTHGITDVVTGVAQEDFGGYPDCRRKFIHAMQETIRRGLTLSETEPMAAFTIHTPLMQMDKAATVLLAKELGPDCWDALALSHTCYKGETPPCGTCHACLLRAKGFELAGHPDPLIERQKGGE